MNLVSVRVYHHVAALLLEPQCYFGLLGAIWVLNVLRT
jgi:hypothetical protein